MSSAQAGKKGGRSAISDVVSREYTIHLHKRVRWTTLDAPLTIHLYTHIPQNSEKQRESKTGFIQATTRVIITPVVADLKLRLTIGVANSTSHRYPSSVCTRLPEFHTAWCNDCSWRGFTMTSIQEQEGEKKKELVLWSPPLWPQKKKKKKQCCFPAEHRDMGILDGRLICNFLRGYRFMACLSRRELHELSRRSVLSPNRLWWVPCSLFLHLSSRERRWLTALSSTHRAPKMSASTPNWTRRSGNPVSRASHSESVSASAVSVTTRRVPRRSFTLSSRPSMSRTLRVCRQLWLRMLRWLINISGPRILLEGGDTKQQIKKRKIIRPNVLI